VMGHPRVIDVQGGRDAVALVGMLGGSHDVRPSKKYAGTNVNT
jgi:hypothetical protein